MKLVVESVDEAALTDALIAIERARIQGIYDDEQLERLGPLVEGLREARDDS